VWIFTRDKTRDSLLELSGLRVAIGPEGSGTRKVALDLLTDAGLPSSAMKLEPVTNLAAVEQFKAGTIDAVILVASPQAPSVQTMLLLPEAHLVNVAQSQALARRVPYLQPILFPQGVVDIKGNIPPRDTTLLTTTANLVMRDDLHPALAFLLLDAANSIHGAPGILNRPGDFPSSKATDFPLADEAKRYFSTGRPFFQRYLPFWLANLAERLLIILIPLMAVAIPLIKMIPDIYKWRMDGRLYKCTASSCAWSAICLPTKLATPMCRATWQRSIKWSATLLSSNSRSITATKSTPCDSTLTMCARG
jgi:hypothetical protein